MENELDDLLVNKDIIIGRCIKVKPDITLALMSYNELQCKLTNNSFKELFLNFGHAIFNEDVQ